MLLIGHDEGRERERKRGTKTEKERAGGRPRECLLCDQQSRSRALEAASPAKTGENAPSILARSRNSFIS